MLLNSSALRGKMTVGILLSLLLFIGLPEKSLCVTDRHTIVIDGINDFFPDEKHETTSSTYGYLAYVTWDADYLYLGCEGPNVGDYLAQRWVVWYLDTIDGDGAQAGFWEGTQQPDFPEGFYPEYHFIWACDNSQLGVHRYEGGYWDQFPAPTDYFMSGDYMELSIPWTWLNTPDTLKLVSSHIREDVPEFTYAGLPANTFVDGYDPDFATYLTAFSGSSTGDLHVVVSPDTLDAPWQISGPDSYYQAGSGTTYLTYLEPGDYSVTWEEVSGWETPPPETGTLEQGEIITFQGLYFEPNGAAILDIGDVPGDQGGQVRISWSRSRFDAPGEVVVTSYEIYRRESSLKIAGWDFVDLVPAHWDSIYQTIAPTLCDSTIATGLCWSTFMIRAATDSPGVFFDSHPDSGYSVDNLAPAIPSGFIMEPSSVLTWTDSPEPDFQNYSVFGSTVNHMDDTAVLLSHTIETSLDVSSVDFVYYLLMASDHAGNQSGAASTSGVSVVSEVFPTSFALLSCYPNPFNPQTTIAFELSNEQAVSLSVYGVSGRLVDVLIDNDIAAQGRNEVVWRGRDSGGRIVPAGVYFYRLEAGSYSETKRMVLVK